jgi:hypothetical protein
VSAEITSPVAFVLGTARTALLTAESCVEYVAIITGVGRLSVTTVLVDVESVIMLISSIFISTIFVNV